jgi:hypothetical protein
MVVFSPLNYPKAHHMASSEAFFGAGIKSTVGTIPGGWSQLFILSAGVGINDGMMAWGDRMLKFTGKKRTDPYRDATHSTIGFWTGAKIYIGGSTYIGLGDLHRVYTYIGDLHRVYTYIGDLHTKGIYIQRGST